MEHVEEIEGRTFTVTLPEALPEGASVTLEVNYHPETEEEADAVIEALGRHHFRPGFNGGYWITASRGIVEVTVFRPRQTRAEGSSQLDPWVASVLAAVPSE